MRLDLVTLRDVLADAWDRWARRCAELTSKQWLTPTRCEGWDVQALIAHVCPGPELFDMLDSAKTHGPAAVTDAAELLRRFNEPGGVAHTTADEIAERAVSEAPALTIDAAAERFTTAAQKLRAMPISDQTVIQYPVAGTTTLAVIVEIAVMEATVHLLDLADAVGGVEPSAEALTATRDLLIAVPDATTMVEVLAGRAAPANALPAIR